MLLIKLYAGLWRLKLNKIMLKNLYIQHLVIIDEVEIDFKSGLNVLTGETGAGKSILLAAINLVLGGKSETRLVAAGKDACQVVAEFEIPEPSSELLELCKTEELPITYDKKPISLTLRRLLKKDGKSKCWFNDEITSLTTLQKLAGELAEWQAQHGAHRLTKIESHKQLLDGFGKYQNLLDKVSDSYKSWQDLLLAQKNLADKIAADKADREYLNHAKKELLALHITKGELEELEQKRKNLQMAEKTSTALNEILELFYDKNGIQNSILKAVKQLNKLQTTGANNNFTEANNNLNQALEHLEIGQQLLEKELNSITEPEMALTDIEDRLFNLKDLARKHRKPVAELPDFLAEIEQQLQNFSVSEKELTLLQEQVAVAKKTYQNHAENLTKARTTAAKELTSRVMAVLPELKLPHAALHIEFIALSEPSASGLEKIQFLCQTNKGQSPDLLHKIASGGELARFLLAIEQAIGSGVDCLIFDEVDSGVGGATANAVGKLLKKLSRNQQCLVITHSPQVAAIGEHHFQVIKTTADNKTLSHVEALNPEQRIKEIARMLSAEQITSEAEAQAKKLLQAS